MHNRYYDPRKFKLVNLHEAFVHSENLNCLVILETSEKKEELEWIPASKLQIAPEQIEERYEADCCTETKMFSNFNLRLIRFDKVMEHFIKMQKQNQRDIVKAELQHSDLIPAKYEGEFNNL